MLGVMGGFIIATIKLGLSEHLYLTNTFDFLTTMDVVSGLAKAAVFGFLIALMGCYHGYNSRGGAEGRGRGHHRRRRGRLYPHPVQRLRADRAVLCPLSRRSASAA